jgi:hypothetical protein
MADNTRVYFVISIGTLGTPSENAWRGLFQQAKTKAFAHAIIQVAHACQNYIWHDKRSQGTDQVRKNTLCGFELAANRVDDLLAVLNEQAVIRGVTGTVKQKFTGVLQAELRESAIDLGYTVNQANQLSVTIVNNGGWARETAIAIVQQYLVDNDAIWHAPA